MPFGILCHLIPRLLKPCLYLFEIGSKIYRKVYSKHSDLELTLCLLCGLAQQCRPKPSIEKSIGSIEVFVRSC